MNDTEKNLMKCVESLYSAVSMLAVALDDGRLTEREGKALNRAFSTYSAAHYDLLRTKEANG